MTSARKIRACQIEIFPVDSVIHTLKNWAPKNRIPPKVVNLYAHKAFDSAWPYVTLSESKKNE